MYQIDNQPAIDEDFLLAAYSLYLRALLHRQSHSHAEAVKAAIEHRKAMKKAPKGVTPVAVAPKKKQRGGKKKGTTDDDDDEETTDTKTETKARILDESGLEIETKQVNHIDPDSSVRHYLLSSFVCHIDSNVLE
jgi:hypothetical protein